MILALSLTLKSSVVSQLLEPRFPYLPLATHSLREESKEKHFVD